MAATKTRYSKDDVQYHDDGSSRIYPAVNVKVYNYRPNIFPIHLGSSYPVGHPEQIEHSYTDEAFTWEWIDEYMSQDEIAVWWQAACEDGYKQAVDLASDIFGPFVEVYAAGRSGGWLVVEGLSTVGEWDAVMLGRWRRYEKLCKMLAADTWRRFAELVYANIYQWDTMEDNDG